MEAAKSGNLEVVNQLVDAKASLDICDKVCIIPASTVEFEIVGCKWDFVHACE